jgi:hypothetical protein
MNWDWIVVKEKAQEAYSKLSQLLVFLGLCLYLLACVVASRPVGPKGYVSFVYHCFQWRPAAPHVTTETSLRKRWFMDNIKVDFSRFTGSRTAESDEVARQQNPQQQLRPQAEIEARPTYHQKQAERDGNSTWSGASGGGGVWAGRSR